MPKISANSTIITLRAAVRLFPNLPGVYLMKDKEGTVIYVGKAKDLKARVRSYFGAGDGRVQVTYLMRRVHAIDTILTENEDQAFIVEADLIKRHMPRYNIKLKDDRAYLSIRINRDHVWPRLELVRKVENDGSLYFGPYSNGYQLRELLEVIKSVVPLRSCSDSVLFNRQRPCLEYEIKRCSAPCVLAVDRGEYKEWIGTAVALIQGKVTGTIEKLQQKMAEAAEDLRFEEAAAHRDRIAILDRFSKGQQIVSHSGENRDVFSLYREGRLGVLCILNIVNGRIGDSRYYSFEDLVMTSGELLESAITQYYQDGRTIPEEIIIPVDLDDTQTLQKYLRNRSGQALEISVPKRGSKFRILKLATLNAKQQFSQQFLAADRFAELSKELKTRFGLRQAPRRIECVDISNTQGNEIVGVVVSFFDGATNKRDYKKYRLSFQGEPNDFAAIHEVVTRRLRHGKEDGDLPDLLIIDGGANQLSKALQAREELGITLDVISIAKIKDRRDRLSGRVYKTPERIFTEEGEAPDPLAPDAPLTHLLQRIRDETHRFAITFHRSRRAKRSLQSALDEVSGVGPERRARLLKGFGSVTKIAAAPPEEVAKVGRMSRLLAEKVIAALQPVAEVSEGESP